MKNRTNIFYKRYLFLLPFFIFTITLHGKNDLKAISDFLDYVIDNKDIYVEQKEQEINSLKKLLKKDDASQEYIFEINQKLAAEYKKYKLDSAIHYAEKAKQIAEILDTPRLKHISDLNMASLYSYSGRFRESESILKTIDKKQLSKDLLANYYEVYLRFFEHYAAVSNQSKYSKQMGLYRDSLMSVLDPSSFTYKINIIHRYLSNGEIEETEKLLMNLLETEGIDTPEYALITHYLGSVSRRKGEPEEEKKYYMLSAIADIKNAIKENASFQRLALIYYDSGDIAKAFKYTQTAIEDAVFSGVQFRTAEMSGFYSIINASYQAKEAKTNSKLKTYLILISILSFFLILLVVYVYKQMKKVSAIKEQLSVTNNKLIDLNNELNEKNDLLNDTNTQLSEANLVKEQYIAQFFNLCSTYIDKMEDYRKALYKVGINRQYEELMKRLKSTSVVDNELDELYTHFDSIFLSLYPTFVSDFNDLLAEDEKIIMKSENMLNKELRIYALLRLGITDSVKISNFLRCSMSTIYNYRTKMRNKAAISREEFEEMVMKIGMAHN